MEFKVGDIVRDKMVTQNYTSYVIVAVHKRDLTYDLTVKSDYGVSSNVIEHVTEKILALVTEKPKEPSYFD